MNRILLVEDDAVLGETIWERLSGLGYAVSWAKSAGEARNCVANASFDLAVIDVNLPDGNGFDLADKLKRLPGTPFLFMTAKASATDRLSAYELGAHEFVPKPFHFRELMIKIRHVLSDHRVPDQLEFKDLKLDMITFNLSVGHQVHQLSPSEANVLRLLIEKSPQCVHRDQMMDQVWGMTKAANLRSIDNIISKLRSLLGGEYSSYLQSVRGKGYRLLPTTEGLL